MWRRQAVFRWSPGWVFSEQVDGWEEAYWSGGAIRGCAGEIPLGPFIARTSSGILSGQCSSSETQWRELLRRLGPTYSWFASVPSDSNIADGPSRDDFSGLENFEAIRTICIFSYSLIQW